MALSIQELNRKDKSIIKPLIAKNKFNPYSNMRFCKYINRLDDYYYDLFFGGKKIKVFSATLNGEITGLLTFSISDWDSKTFGMKMAKFGYINATGDYAQELAIKNGLLAKSLEYARAQAVKHLSIRVASDDFSSIHAFESCGFKLMDNLVAYIMTKNTKIVLPKAKRWFTVKEITKKDLAAAGNLLADRCIFGHYSFDPSIPPLKVKNMYKSWLKSKFNDRKNNDIFIAKRNGRIVGCSLFSSDALLKKYTGLKIMHRGIMAVESSASGCLFALANANIEKRRSMDLVEFETQTYNYNMMYIMQKLGMRLIRSRYTFHKTL